MIPPALSQSEPMADSPSKALWLCQISPHGFFGMEKRIAPSLRKLTKRITAKLGRPESVVSILPVPVTVIMAEAEEDFSSLPLPDRFQHKVGIKYYSSSLSKRTNPRPRSGKSAKQPTKMLRKNSRLHPTSITHLSNPSFEMDRCGREQSQIQTLQHNRKE